MVAAPLPPSTVDDEEESSSGFWIGLLIGVILCLVVALVCGLYVHKLRKRLEFLEISKLSRSCPVSAPLIDEEEKPPEQPAEPAPPPPAPLPPPPPLVDPGETVDASIGVEWVAEEKKAGDRRSSTGSFTGSDILAAVAPIHVSEWNTGPAKPVGAAGRSGGAPASAGRPRRRQSNGSEKGAAPRGEGPHPAVHSPTGRPRRRQSSGSEKGAASHSPQWPEEERRGPAGAAPGTPLPAGRAAALAALAQVPPRSVTTPASALHDHPGPDADADAAGNLGVYAAPGREGSPKAAWERRQGTRQQKPVGPPPRHAASDAARSATTASPLAPPKSYYNVNFGAPATASTLPSASPLTAGRGSGTAGAPARAPAPIDPITDLLNMQTVAPPGRRNVRAADSRDRAGRGQGV